LNRLRSEPDQKGKPKRIKKVVGALAKFPTEDEAWTEVERLGLGRSFDEHGPRNLEELADHFSKTELSEEQSEDDWRASSTKEVYRLYLKNWIVPRWGSSPLDQVKAVAVEEWLRKKVERAPGTKKKIRDVMHVLYTHAIHYEWTTRNPITSVRQSGKRQSAPALISIEDLSKLIFEVLELRERAMVLLDFGGGLRRGEVAGVKREDIDFERGQVLPKRSIVSQVVGETKTEASSKPIPLDDSLLQNGMGSQGGAGTAASCQSENYHGHLQASSLAREAQSSSRGDPNGGSATGTSV
jgi:integrase